MRCDFVQNAEEGKLTVFERPNFDEICDEIQKIVGNQGSVFRGCTVHFEESHASRSNFSDFGQNFDEISMDRQNGPTV